MGFRANPWISLPPPSMRCYEFSLCTVKRSLIRNQVTDCVGKQASLKPIVWCYLPLQFDRYVGHEVGHVERYDAR